MANPTAQIATLIGRILLSLIFLLSSVHKITDWDQTLPQMEREGIVAVPLMLLGTIILELGGGLSLLVGFRPRIGASMLICFLVPVTLIIHDFWAYTGQEQQMQLINFMKNLAILGGLLIVAAQGAGSCCTIDSQLAKRRTEMLSK